ncbi:MAG: LiaF domain-containing protein [Gaiellaceae bacterium]
MSGRAGLGIVLLAAGVLWLLAAADVVDVSYRVAVGALLVVIGVVIMVSRGRRALLVLVGILVVLAGIPALFVDSDVWSDGIGDAVEAPASRADLEPFEHGIGKLTVDLTTPGLPLDDASVEASLGIGDLLVLVPRDTDVSLDAHVGVGNIQAFGEEENGVDVDLSGITGTSGSQELDLELDVGIGNIRVELR